MKKTLLFFGDMKFSSLVLLVFLLVFGSCFSAEKKLRLVYLPDQPVRLNSEIYLEFSQSLPGLSLSARGSQVLKANLSIKNGQQDLPISHPPFDLEFALQSLKIMLRINDEDLAFDSENQDGIHSLYLSQISKMIDRPITLHIGEGFKLETGIQELMQKMPEIPSLKEIKADAVFVDLFTHLFALAGTELKEGMMIERHFADTAIPALPDTVTYTITSIDDFHVHSTFKGDIEKKAFTLTGSLPIGGKDPQDVSVSLNGSMEGCGKWNRDNALLYELRANYSFTAMFRLGEWEWIMNISAIVQQCTEPNK